MTLPQRIEMMTLAQRLVDACMLEEDDDPCVVDRQLDGQDDSISVSVGMSHTLDDLMFQ
jgi:hypothetical protein